MADFTRRSLLAGLGAFAARASASTRPPNIVWIWADNLAYRDLGAYGNPAARTPTLDRLASQGVRFTQYYIAHTVCSPSRAALLTGRQPFRAGIVDVLRPDSPSGIPSDEITLGEALRERGYATQAIGKWHLGDRPEFLPTRHGFDHYLGMPYSMDMAPSLLYRDERIIDDLAGAKVAGITERYAEETIDFLNRNRARPFFLYFSHTIPHPPLVLPERARTPGRSAFEDAVTHMDEQTGRVLDALDRLDLRDNTLVFFSSDNGPMAAGGDTGGLRGGIRDAYEGGVRVPLLARWPGRIPAGRVAGTPAIAYDIFPTILNLAGGRPAGDRVYDGQDIWPLLSGQGAFARRQPFYWVYLDRVSAVRDGKWKLHVAQREKPLRAPELYDLEADPGERHNLRDREPRVVESLLAKIQAFQTEVPKVWPLQYPVRDSAKRHGGVRKQ